MEKRNTVKIGLASLLAGAMLVTSGCGRPQGFSPRETKTSASPAYCDYTKYMEYAVKDKENATQLIQQYTGLSAGEIYRHSTRNTWRRDNGYDWNQVIPAGQKVKIRIPDNYQPQ